MTKKMDHRLTELQAFHAMQKFLELYYERTHSDDVGSLLGDLQLTSENEPFDPAAWDDWINSVNAVLSERKNK